MARLAGPAVGLMDGMSDLRCPSADGLALGADAAFPEVGGITGAGATIGIDPKLGESAGTEAIGLALIPRGLLRAPTLEMLDAKLFQPLSDGMSRDVAVGGDVAEGSIEEVVLLVEPQAVLIEGGGVDHLAVDVHEMIALVPYGAAAGELKRKCGFKRVP